MDKLQKIDARVTVGTELLADGQQLIYASITNRLLSGNPDIQRIIGEWFAIPA
jgi:hypothetical protein